jgi:hypothetical protein
VTEYRPYYVAPRICPERMTAPTTTTNIIIIAFITNRCTLRLLVLPSCCCCCKHKTTTTIIMCRPDLNPRSNYSQNLGLLLSLRSYDPVKNGQRPSIGACLSTGIFIVAFLTSMEMTGRYLLERMIHLHPILTIELNRQILARHLFVDAFSCSVCAAMGWFGRHIAIYPVANGIMPKAAYDHRLLSYSPHGFRLSLFFFWYQIKNLHDTIVWNDGPEFIFHHLLSLGM